MHCFLSIAKNSLFLTIGSYHLISNWTNKLWIPTHVMVMPEDASQPYCFRWCLQHPSFLVRGIYYTNILKILAFQEYLIIGVKVYLFNSDSQFLAKMLLVYLNSVCVDLHIPKMNCVSSPSFTPLNCLYFKYFSVFQNCNS